MVWEWNGLAEPLDPNLQVANSLALGTSPIVRALLDPEGGMRDVRALDSVSFTDWFKGHGGSQASIDRMWCEPRAWRHMSKRLNFEVFGTLSGSWSMLFCAFALPSGTMQRLHQCTLPFLSHIILCLSRCGE